MTCLGGKTIWGKSTTELLQTGLGRSLGAKAAPTFEEFLLEVFKST
jgi:hypothetical protein